MTPWKRTIAIKQHLDRDKPLAEARDPIVAILKRDPAYQSDPEFVWAVDAMAEATDVDDFDEGLASLYDWADFERVWISGTPAHGHDLFALLEAATVPPGTLPEGGR